MKKVRRLACEGHPSRSEADELTQVDHLNMCSIYEVIDVTSSDSLLVGRLARSVLKGAKELTHLAPQ